MKLYNTCKYYLLLLLTAALLCGCTRPAPSAEPGQTPESASYGPGQQEPALTESTPPSKEECEKAQADFDAFTSEVFREELAASPLSLNCIVRHPENYGIEATDMTLGSFSMEELTKSIEEAKAEKARLEAFNPSALTQDQVFTRNMFMDYLDTMIDSEGLDLYTQNFSPLIGTQAQLPIILAEYTFSEKKDVENYLSLLSSIDDYYAQLADFEKLRSDAGLGQSDDTLDRIIQSCKDYMIRPESSFLTETFNSKLEEVPDLSEEEKIEFKARHSAALKEHFIPAYENLVTALEALKGHGTNENGLYYFEDGKRYYEYLVAAMTGTASSVPELKKRISGQMDSEVSQMTLLLKNNPDLFEEAEACAFTPTDPMEILDSLKTECLNDFPELSGSTFTVKRVPKALESSLSPAFFLIPPIDSYEKGTIYINGMSEQAVTGLYTTLAHEGYPGHLYQSLYFARKESCPLRHLLTCDGYSEGWGTYAEIYSYSFNNGLTDDVQKLMACNSSVTLSLYALLDINIHYEGWDLAKTTGYLNKFYGIDDPAVCKEVFDSIVENPANYLKYYTGYLEIINMRETAMETLGSRYDAKTFHKFVLDMEGAPFRVIEPYFQTWLLTYGVRADD